MTWNRPLGGYDFFLVDVTGGDSKGYDSLPQHYAGSCANGTIVRADQTQITCGPFPPCSSITFTVSTFSKGPPEHISMGATLKDVFVSGKDPNKPGGITMVPKSPYTTQIQWEPPPSLDGTIDVYKVTVCEKSQKHGWISAAPQTLRIASSSPQVHDAA
ncbi:hypothetical protein HPB50_019026 [Hyalomma asiaticum]|uniref:Uncharacterized protein n=1 Tax=Hyalomma asiaticum TaxID=266040 RepID=A0ACB7RS27_HYAAI|nr:hypothetical protein HPB50_019026 [Hyalomma asiaticum]